MTAALMLHDGTVWRGVKHCDKARVVRSAAVAAAGAAVLWAPAAGTKIILFGLSVAVSVSGKYRVQGGTFGAIWIGMLIANQSFAVPIPTFGVNVLVVDEVLSIRNDTAGAADLDATAYGIEI